MHHIQPMGLFHTPEDSDEIMAWIKKHPQVDQPSLVTVMGMTWNLLATAITEAEQITEADEDHMQDLTSAMADMKTDQLGKRLIESIGETCHMGWEAAGYTREQVHGIRGFLDDFING